jgi:hypothetical protein
MFDETDNHDEITDTHIESENLENRKRRKIGIVHPDAIHLPSSIIHESYRYSCSQRIIQGWWLQIILLLGNVLVAKSNRMMGQYKCSHSRSEKLCPARINVYVKNCEENNNMSKLNICRNKVDHSCNKPLSPDDKNKSKVVSSIRDIKDEMHHLTEIMALHEIHKSSIEIAKQIQNEMNIKYNGMLIC